jgi:hypothetical protein
MASGEAGTHHTTRSLGAQTESSRQTWYSAGDADDEDDDDDDNTGGDDGDDNMSVLAQNVLEQPRH